MLVSLWPLLPKLSSRLLNSMLLLIEEEPRPDEVDVVAMGVGNDGYDKGELEERGIAELG